MNRDNLYRPTESDIEKFLAEEFEGGLFAEIAMTNISGKTFFVRRDLYTVLSGICYELGSGKPLPTGDTMISIKANCNRIGKYDPNKEYKCTVSKNYSYAEIKKLFKL